MLQKENTQPNTLQIHVHRLSFLHKVSRTIVKFKPQQMFYSHLNSHIEHTVHNNMNLIHH